MESISNSSEVSEDVTTDTNALHIFHVISNSILIIFGVPGNCLILRVYWTKTRKTSTHVLIMALAWSDLVVCLLRSCSVCERVLELVGVSSEQVTTVTKFFWPFEFTVIGTSVLITTLIAGDRYDCICRPQKRYFTSRRSKTAAYIAVLVSLGASIPAFLRIINFSTVLFKLQVAFQTISFVIALMTIVFCYGKVYSTIRKHVRVGAVRRQVQNLDEDRSKINECCSRIEPPNCAVLTSNVDEVLSKSINHVHNFQTGSLEKITKHQSGVHSKNLCRDETNEHCSNQRSKHPMRKDASLERDSRAPYGGRRHQGQDSGTGFGQVRNSAVVLQRKTTRMLFVTSVVFLLTWMPYFIWFGMRLAEYGGVIIRQKYWDISRELLTAVYINNVVNPLIYGLANRRFRQDCREVMRKFKLCSTQSSISS